MILNAEAVAAGQASPQIIIRTRFWDDALLDAQTVWLVEGLRQYLDASAVDRPGGGASAASRSDFSTKRVVLSNRMRQAAVPAPAWTNVWEAMVPALMTGLGLRHAD
jgi:hypothetical protein